MVKNKIFQVAFLLLIFNITLNAATKTWIGNGTNTSWKKASNWSGGIPGPSDIAIFNGSGTGDCLIDTATVSIAGIQLNAGYTGTVQQTSTNTSFIVGSSNGVFSSGLFDGNSSSTPITFNGTFTLSGGEFDNGNVIFNNTVTNTSGNFIGYITTFNSSSAQIIPAWEYSSLISSSTGARTLASAGIIYIDGTFSPGTNSYTATGSTINYDGFTPQTIAAFNYYNLTIATFSPFAPINVTLASGTIGVAGSFTNSAGLHGGTFISTGNTIDFNGVTQNIPAFTYNNLTCSGTGDKTATGTLTVNGALTVNSGIILNMSTFQLLGSALTTSGAGTLKTANVTVPAIPTGRNWSFTVEYNGTTAQTIPVGTYTNLTISGARTTTSVTLASGTIGISGTLTNSATFAGGGFITTGNTIDFNGVTQNIPLFTYNNLTCSGTGDKTSAFPGFTVNGLLTINSGRILNMSTFQLLGSALTTSGTGTLKTANTTVPAIPTGRTWTFTVEYNGTTAQTVPVGTYTNLTVSGARTTTSVTLASGTIGISGTLTNSSTFAGGGFITTGNTIDFNGVTQNMPSFTFNNIICSGTGDKTATGDLTVNGSLTINSGRILNMSTFQLLGSALTTSGTGTLKTANVTVPAIPTGRTWSFDVEYNGTTGQTVPVGTYTNLTISGARTTTSVTLASGTIGISGTLTNSATFAGGGFISTGNTIDFNGVTQNIPAFTFNNITCSGTGDKTATGDLTVNGSLTINSGRILNMSTFQLLGSALTTGGTGTLKTANVTVPAIPTGRTWSFDVEYNGTTGQTVPVGTYTNLTFNANANTSGGLTVNGILTIASGKVLNMQSYALSGSTITTSGTGTLKTANVTVPAIPTGRTWSFDVEYNGTTAQTIPVGTYTNLTISGARTTTSVTLASGTIGISGTLTNSATFAGGGFISTGNTIDFNGVTQNIPAFTFNNITCSGTGDKTATGDLTVNGSLTINSGRILNMSTFQLLGSALTTSGTGTLKTANVTVPAIPTGRTWSFDVEYNGTTGQTVPVGTYTNLTISGARTTTSLTLASGTIGISGTLTNSATFAGGGFISTGNTIDFNGVTQNIPAFTFNNITCSGTGDKTATGDLTVNGSLTINSGRILNMSTFQLLGSALTTSGTGTLKTANVTVPAIPTGRTWSFTVEYNGTTAQTVPVGTYTNLTISGARTTTSVTLASGTIGISGTLTNSATFAGGGFISTGNTIDFNGAAQNIPAFTFNNITCSGTGDKTATGDLTVNGSLTINSGRILNMSTFQLLGSALTTSGTGTLKTANVTVPAIPTGRTWSFTVEYNGTTAQTVPVGTYTNLTISGARTTTSVTLASGTIGISGTLTNLATFAGGGFITTGNTIDFNGVTQNIAAFTFNNLTCSGTGDKTATGDLTVNGILNINTSRILDMGTNALAGTMSSATGAGTLRTQKTTSALPVGKSWIPTVEYNSASSQTIVYGSYKDLNGTGGARTFSSTDTVHISGTFTAGAGVYTVTGSTVDFNGSSQNIPLSTYNNLAIRGTGDKAATGDLTINGILNINTSRILNMGTNALAGTMSSATGAGTLRTQKTTSALPLGKSWIPTVEYNSASSQTIVYGSYKDLNGTGGARTFSSTDTVHISGGFTSGAGVYTVTGSTVDFNGAAQIVPSLSSYNNLKISGTGNKTAGGTITVNGALVINSGATLDLASNNLAGTLSSLTGVGILKFQGSNPIPSGKVWPFTVELNGGVQSIVNGTYANLIISGTGDKGATGNLTINNNLTVNSGRILDMGVNTLSGITTTSGTGIIKTQNTGSTPIPANTAWSCGIQYNSDSPQNIVSGNYIDLDGTGGNRVLSSTGIIGVSGVFTKGIGIYTITGSTFDFNGGASQSIPAYKYNNLTISGTRTSNNVTLATGTITVTGNMAVNSTFSSGGFVTTGNTILFNGTSNQYINGTSTAYFDKLSVNKTTGKIRLYQPAIVKQQLILSKGVLSTSATNYLQINNGADTVQGASDSSYVCGPIKKVGSQIFKFPLGDTVLALGAYHPLSITAPVNATDAYTAQYLASNQTYGTAIQTDSLESISDCEYWTLTRNAGTSVVIPSVSWNVNSTNIYDRYDVCLAGWNGTQWTTLGQSAISYGFNTGTINAAFGLNLTGLPIVIANPRPMRPIADCTLKKNLDAGYYTLVKGLLRFKYEEEYVENGNELEFKIYDKNRNVVISNTTAGVTLNLKYKDQRYSLNVKTVSPSLASGFYVMEVKDRKGEITMLRFKL